MSGSDQQTASVELESRVASLELSIVADDFRPLAAGVGRLSATLEPGIYQVVARAGPIVDRKLISLAAGTAYVDRDVQVTFPAAAPVEGTSTSHEYHQHFAQQASQQVFETGGAESGLAIVVRDVRGLEGPPLTADDLAPFRLLGDRLDAIVGFDQRWEVHEQEAVATWSGRLPAGGYALRTDPAALGSGPRQPATRQPFDQSLWLSPGWQTLVFITTGPHGPQTSAASVHMTSLDAVWNPYEVDIGLALELAGWGLREGRSVLPVDLLNVLLGSKFGNPMLGLVAAHSLLLREPIDVDLLDIVLRNLDDLVAGHPDLLALHWLAARARQLKAADEPADGDTMVMPGQETTPAPAPPLDGAIWPPMLVASYRALIEMDARDPGVIVDGSPAERAAAELLVQGLWTSWRPLPVEPQTEPAPDGPPMWVLRELGRDPTPLSETTFHDPATARVASYLAAVAALEGPRRRTERFVTLSPQEIGIATSLPSPSVDRALVRIGKALPSPVTTDERTTDGDGRSSGGGGGLMGALPFVLAGVLVLAGAAAVVARDDIGRLWDNLFGDSELVFPAPDSPQSYGASFNVNPTSRSGLVVELAASGGCSATRAAEGWEVTMTSGSEPCLLTATQDDGTAEGTDRISWTVAAQKRPLSARVEDVTFTYGDPPLRPAVTFDGFLADDSAASLSGAMALTFTGSGLTEYGPSPVMPQGVGSYEVIAGGLTSDDYELVHEPGTLVIGARLVSGSFTAADKVYDGNDGAVIERRSLSGVLAGDEVALAGDSARFSDKNAGRAKTVTGTDFALEGPHAVNYELESATLTTTADIAPRQITGTFTAQDKVYDGTAEAIIAERSLSGAIEGDDVSLTGGSATFEDRHAGSAKPVTGIDFTLAGSDAPNYLLESTTLRALADITPRPITVSAVSDSKVYDGTTDSDGVPLIGEPGVANGDRADFTQFFEDANVGTGKRLTPEGVIEDGNQGLNYAITFVEDTSGEISPRPVTVAAEPKSKIIGQPDPPLTYQVVDGSVVAGDNFSGMLARQPGEALGTYDIGQGSLSLGGNYTLNFVPAQFTITTPPIN